MTWCDVDNDAKMMIYYPENKVESVMNEFKDNGACKRWKAAML